MSEPSKHKHHRSMPSLSFSTVTTENPIPSPKSHHVKRHSDSMPTKRWDDSPFEMELAEDDFIKEKKTSPPWIKFPKLKRKLSRPDSNRLLKKVYTWLL
ncbi:hypothetical protein G6F56_012307 [Rhizopus delemar]|nr:hypothetical protein G6F56_012307 [Rhizopus delemar]